MAPKMMKKAPMKNAVKKGKAYGEKAYVRFSQAERALSFKWMKAGKQPTDIAELLGRDKGTISRQLAKPEDTVPQLGRPVEFAEDDYEKLQAALDFLIKKAKAEKEVTLFMVKKRAGVDASDPVCRKLFQDHGVHFFKLREKPILTEDDVATRVAFQKRYGHKSSDGWNKSPHGIIDSKHYPMYLDAKGRSHNARRGVRGAYRTAEKVVDSNYVGSVSMGSSPWVFQRWDFIENGGI